MKAAYSILSLLTLLLAACSASSPIGPSPDVDTRLVVPADSPCDPDATPC